MDFGLNMEQKLLQKSVREFLGKEFSKDVVRQLEEDDGFSPKLWRKMAEMGWLGILFPGEYDGSEMTFFDLALVLQEMGYNLCPGPFFATVVLSGAAILTAGKENQKAFFLPKIANGEIICTLAVNEPGALYDISNLKTKATLEGKEAILNGTKIFVPDAHLADWLLVAAETGSDGKMTILLVDAKSPGITVTPLKSLAHDKQFEVRFENVRAPVENVLGKVGQGRQITQDVLEKATAARCTEMIGGAQAAMDLAMDHAKTRVQFGRPIGSFQAIQHHFANMYIDINASKILAHRAVSKISAGKPAAKDVAMAKARTGETFRRVTLLAHQVFGAMGFTMESNLYLYHRRAISSDQAFGNYDFQREKVAQELGL